MNEKFPNSDLKPGSSEAVEAGCTCPILDNAHGKGRGGDGERFGWIIMGDCPLHNRENRKKVPLRQQLIQAAAAEAVKETIKTKMVDFAKKVEDLGGTVYFPTHDEIIVDAPEGKEEEVVRLMNEFWGSDSP